RSYCGFPFAIWRTGSVMVARDNPEILDLECLHCTAYIHGSRGFDRVPDAHVSYGHGRDIPVRLFLKRHHVRHVKFVVREFFKVKRLVIGMPESQSNWAATT